MNRITSVVVAALLPAALYVVPANAQRRNPRPSLAVGGGLGYYGGTGFQVSGTISNFAEGLPLSARLTIGLSLVTPGDPWAARRVFVNNNTNGVPETSGHMIDLRLDVTHPVRLFHLQRAYLYGGLRRNFFLGKFTFIDGNEEFEITSRHWGLGLGVDSYFRMGRNIDLVATTGFDYYFPSSLSGHDTTYSPDNNNVNPEGGYQYQDADKAINQPKLEPRLMLGLSYRF
jgi:hypothetical protein